MHNMKNTECPWWNAKNGIKRYISSKTDGGILDLSFCPLSHKEELTALSNILANNNVTELKLKDCSLITDECFSGLNNGDGSGNADAGAGADADADADAGAGAGADAGADADADADGNVRRLDKTGMFENYFQRKIVRLDLSGCNGLTDAACDVIASFVRLESLSLNNCVQLSDSGLMVVLDSCKYLVEIRLKNLHRFQDEGMACLTRNLVMMKLLRILGTFTCLCLVCFMCIT